MTESVSSGQYVLRTLGELALYEAGGARPADLSGDPLLADAKSLAVLAYLEAVPGGRARRDHVASLLWPDRETDKRRKALRQALYYLRQKAGHDFLSGDDRLALEGDRLTVDRAVFFTAVDEERYGEAVELYGGEYLGGFDSGSREYRRWREAQQERLWSQLKLACKRAVEEALRRDDPEEALPYARRWVETNPLDEQARSALIEVLLAADRNEEAYGQYEEYRALLVEGEDEPGQELRRRADRIHERLFDPVPDEPSEVVTGDSPDRSTEKQRTRRSSRWWTLVTAVVVVGVLSAAGTWWWNGRSARPLDSVRAELYARTPGEGGIQKIGIHAGAVNVDDTPYEDRTVVSPSGRRAVGEIASPQGLDLVLLGRGGDTLRRLTEVPSDERAWDWSPDGSKVLYGAGREAVPGEVWRWELRALDLEEGQTRSYTTVESGDVGQARWSPLGGRIAYTWNTGQSSRIAVVHADGRRRRLITSDSTGARSPAWSPYGQWIVFVSDRTGNAELYIIRSDGSHVRQVTNHPASDRSPVWLSRDQLAFVSDRGGRDRLWTVHLPTGDTRLLLEDRETTRIEAVRRRPGRRWIDSLVLHPRWHVFGAAERVPFRVEAWDASGRRLQPEVLPIRWESSDSEVLRIRDAPVRGLFRHQGGTSVLASAGGWRTDTLNVTVGRLVPRNIDPVYREDWDGGDALSGGWIPFGEPSPTVFSSGGSQFSRVFANRGDDHFASGAVSRETFGVTGGLTLVAWGKAPLNQPLQQRWSLGLARAAPAKAHPTWETRDLPVILRVNGPDGEAVFRTSDQKRPGGLGSIAAPGTWHRYALQVTPEGRVWVVVDGRLRRRTVEPVLAPGEAHHVVLAGRSEATRILHGPIAVYDRPLYRLHSPSTSAR